MHGGIHIAEVPLVGGYLSIRMEVNLIRHQLLTSDLANSFLGKNVERLSTYTSAEVLGSALVEARLLTPYQFERIMAGTTHGLILGNHRVLERIGAGSMGIVFLAEHLFMKRQVAIKVLPVDDECPPLLLERFNSEMRVLAGLQHPHIVTAYDGGQLAPPYPGPPTLLYLVMELISGGDLEQLVIDKGPVPTVATFRESEIATLSRTSSHLIQFSIEFKDGAANDTVKIYIDSKLVENGTTWEDYYRYDPEQTPQGNKVPTVDKLLFRESGTAHPLNALKGFLLDRVILDSSGVNVRK